MNLQGAKGWLRWCLAVLALGLAGCDRPAPPPAPPAGEAREALEAVSWEMVAPYLPADAGGLRPWADALSRSVTYYEARDPGAVVVFADQQVPAPLMALACRQLATLAERGDAQALWQKLSSEFRAFRATGRPAEGDMLVTAYYEPLLRGSLQAEGAFRHPLYRRPPELIGVDLSLWRDEWQGQRLFGYQVDDRLVPFHDREAIDGAGVLAGRGLELVWADDPLDVFFLHVQGSGRVALPDGRIMGVGYAGANGQPYRSIGRLLIDEGAVSREDMSLPVLRRWLRQHPDQQTRVLQYNPSYVFFRQLPGGAQGNIGVELTPGHSVATDARLFPKGAPGLLVTEMPVPGDQGVAAWVADRRWVANQDTGGAIVGPGRVDLFLGFGEAAEARAGVMKQPGGRLFLFAPGPSFKAEPDLARTPGAAGPGL
ncbi:MAG: murein transglycosylase A [Magnetococcus sp. WYHC-3]